MIVSTYSSLAVTFSLLQASCRAGPIDIGMKTCMKAHNVHVNELYLRNDSSSAAVPEFVRRTAQAPGTKGSPSLFAVMAVMGTIILICLLIMAVLLTRRRKRLQKVASDGELGFGQQPMCQLSITAPPKAYDRRSSSSSPADGTIIEKPGSSRTSGLLNIPPSLEVSVVQMEQKQKRIPVPRLPALPSSPRPKQRPGSVKISGADERIATPGDFLSPLPRVIKVLDEPPLSANGLERMILSMEMELKGDM